MVPASLPGIKTRSPYCFTVTIFAASAACLAAACAAIYAPYVTDTAITFEYEPPSAAEMARRIAADHFWDGKQQ